MRWAIPRAGETIGDLVKQSFLKAVLTDPHFWAPVVVLILGVGLLVAMR